MFEGGLDVVGGCNMDQLLRVLGNSEHNRVGFHELDVDWQVSLSPFVGP